MNTTEKINNALKNEDFIFAYNISSEENLIKRITSIDNSKNIEEQLLKNDLRIISFSKNKFIYFKDYFKKEVFEVENIKKDNNPNKLKNKKIKTKKVNLKKDKEELSQDNLELFKLLADLLNIPFRRDTMLRVLRDSYANTDNPGVEMIGKLSVSLGLHAVAAKIPPKY